VSEPFLGEIKIVSFNFPPRGWALCNGQLLPINQNQALFSILGTTYGGDGTRTFGLPNLQGRTPIHVGNSHVLGEIAGEAAHTLNIGEMTAHTHLPVATSVTPNAASPAGAFWGNAGVGMYSSSPPTTSMDPQAVATVGGSQPHQNLSPYLVLNFIIALQGIFPSQN
jgi:microcystin-dependent protein